LVGASGPDHLGEGRIGVESVQQSGESHRRARMPARADTAALGVATGVSHVSASIRTGPAWSRHPRHRGSHRCGVGHPCGKWTAVPVSGYEMTLS
jgi:hypothetical protein